MRTLSFAMVGLTLWAAGSGWSQTKTGAVTLKRVDYDGLKQAVVQQRGKVVLVDFWSDLCFPCKKAMPGLVEKHRKYSDKGLVIITVALDALATPDEADPGKNLRFLQATGANFLNLYLEDPTLKLHEKFGFSVIPAYYVFSRQGKWTLFSGSGETGVDYEEMDRLIQQLLAEK